MKTTKHKLTGILAAAYAAFIFTAAAQGTRVSERPSLAAGDVAAAVDLLAIVDVSAGAAGSKKITIADLFTGWGFTAAGADVAKAASFAEMVALLPPFTGPSGGPGLKGLVPAPGADDAGKFLRADATWVSVGGGGDLLAANNLSDLANAATALGNLGAEPALGNPGTNGFVLASQTDGTRSWVAAGAGDVTLSGAETLTNKTLGSGTIFGAAPTMTLGSDGTGDLYYRAGGGALTRLAAGTDGEVLTLASGLPNWVAAGGGGGGLTHFTEDVSTASPNATVPVVSLTATDAATNVNLAIIPKGTGAILAAIPSGTATGGNQRGDRSVDFQTARTSAAQVASGFRSGILCGQNNRAYSNYSIAAGANNAAGFQGIALGFACTAAANQFGGLGSWAIGHSASATTGGAMALGYSTSATAAYSVAMGQGTTASGIYALAVQGTTTASGAYSFASGFQSTTRGIHGAASRSSGQFAVLGDAQTGGYLLRRATATADPVEISTNAGNAAAATRIVLPNNHAYKFRGQAVARHVHTGDIKTWDITGTIKRGADAAATAIVGAVDITVQAADAGASAWELEIDADTTNGSLRVRVTGEALKTIRWLVNIETVEIG